MRYDYDKKSRLGMIFFDSIQEGFRFREGVLENKSLRDQNLAYVKSHGNDSRWTPDWTGCTSAAQFKERVLRGWAEGADKLSTLSTRDINPTSVRRRRVRGDQGDELDIHSVYRGDLSRAWTRTRRQARQGTNRSVTIVCNICASASVDSERLFWRGASVLKLADALTTAGYSVRIVAGQGGFGIDASCKESCGVLFDVKAEDQPLDVADLASIVALTGYFRTVGFAAIVAACDKQGKDAASALGRPSQENLIKTVNHYLPDTNAIVQPDTVLDRKSAEQWIDSTLTALEPKE